MIEGCQHEPTYLVAPDDRLDGEMVVDGLRVGRSSANGASKVESGQGQSVGLNRGQVRRAGVAVAPEIGIPGL